MILRDELRLWLHFRTVKLRREIGNPRLLDRSLLIFNIPSVLGALPRVGDTALRNRVLRLGLPREHLSLAWLAFL